MSNLLSSFEKHNLLLKALACMILPMGPIIGNHRLPMGNQIFSGDLGGIYAFERLYVKVYGDRL